MFPTEADHAGTEAEWEREDMLPKTNRALLALAVHRQFLSPRDTQPEEQLTPLEARLLFNVKTIAMALQMFLTDHDALPDVKTTEEARAMLEEYLKTQDVWLRPDGKDVVVRYLAPPGTKISDIDDPSRFAVVVIDFLPDWDMVGYADGHAKRWRKGEWEGGGQPPS
jgi:hypothetical protein